MEEIVSKIVGTQFYPESKKVLNALKVNDELQLVREPDNEHDENAIAIYFSSEKYGKTHPIKIGHISAYQAEVVTPIMDKKEFNAKCIVKEITGHSWICPNSFTEHHPNDEISMDILKCPNCSTHIRRAHKLKRFRGCNISIQLFDESEKLKITEKAEDMNDDELEDMLNEMEEDL